MNSLALTSGAICRAHPILCSADQRGTVLLVSSVPLSEMIVAGLAVGCRSIRGGAAHRPPSGRVPMPADICEEFIVPYASFFANFLDV